MIYMQTTARIGFCFLLACFDKLCTFFLGYTTPLGFSFAYALVLCFFHPRNSNAIVSFFAGFFLFLFYGTASHVAFCFLCGLFICGVSRFFKHSLWGMTVCLTIPFLLNALSFSAHVFFENLFFSFLVAPIVKKP